MDGLEWKILLKWMIILMMILSDGSWSPLRSENYDWYGLIWFHPFRKKTLEFFGERIMITSHDYMLLDFLDNHYLFRRSLRTCQASELWQLSQKTWVALFIWDYWWEHGDNPFDFHGLNGHSSAAPKCSNMGPYGTSTGRFTPAPGRHKDAKKNTGWWFGTWILFSQFFPELLGC